jgi:hypothetical protein
VSREEDEGALTLDSHPPFFFFVCSSSLVVVSLLPDAPDGLDCCFDHGDTNGPRSPPAAAAAAAEAEEEEK